MIPAAAWNACEAHHTRSRQAALERSRKVKLKLRLSPEQPAATTTHQDTTPSPTRQEGKTALGDPTKTDFTHTSPCLEFTCTTCEKGHAHLTRKQSDPDAQLREHELEHWLWTAETLPFRGISDLQRNTKPPIEPLTPLIDPRILDGTWRIYQPSPVATPTTSPTPSLGVRTPMLTPVDKSYPLANNTHITPSPPQYIPYPPRPQRQPTPPTYDIFLPTSLVKQTISGAPARTAWRSEPRKRLTVRLRVGKKLGDLLKRREKKERKREYDRAYRARKKQRRE